MIYEEEIIEHDKPLVDRLREMDWGPGLCKIAECQEAADEIERLREALRPFAAFAFKEPERNNGEWYEDWPDSSDLERKFIEAAKVLGKV
jgi:hypothetical protein